MTKERNLIETVVHRWNADHSETAGCVLLPQRWEVNAIPEMGDRPQGIINRQLVDKSDMIIGVFWTRLGSPTGVSPSGTAEELERGQKAGKPVALYFSNLPIVPSTVDPEQLALLADFKQRQRSAGLTFDYGDLTDLERSVNSMLTQVTRERFDVPAEIGASSIPAAPKAAVSAFVNRVPNTRGGTDYRVALRNDGLGRASDVTVNADDQNAAWNLMDADLPIDYLPPGSTVDFHAGVHLGSSRRANYIVTWRNEDGSAGEQRFTLSL